MQTAIIVILFVAAIKDITETVYDYSSQTHRRYSWFVYSLKIIVVIALLGAAFYQIKETEKKDYASADSGQIFTKTYTEKEYPVLKLGHIAMKNVGNALTMQGISSLIFYKENGKLVVKTNIKDSKGNTIFSIDGDDFQMFNAYADYNRDDNAIELVRSDKRVIFQMELKNDTVYCQGIFFEQGLFLAFCESKVTDGNVPPHSEMIWLPKTQCEIKRIFKYPRKEHSRERIE